MNDARRPNARVKRDDGGGDATNDAANAPIGSRRRIARGVAAVSVLALCIVAGWAYANRWLPAREVALARGTGWIALGMLLLSLLVTPLARIAMHAGLAQPRMAMLPLVRRALGMAAAWLGLVHLLCSISGTLSWNWAALWTWPHLRAGLTALGILVVLLATSFARVVAALRLRFWRELHRLAYVAPLLVLQHMLLSPFGSRTLALSLITATYVLGLLRWW